MISTIREIAWKKQGVCFKRAHVQSPRLQPEPGAAWGHNVLSSARELQGKPPAKGFLLTRSWTQALPAHFCETGKITPGWVAGDMNPDMSLSLWRASAEAMQLILKTDCQKKMKESMGEAMRSRKQEKPGAGVWQVPSILLKPLSTASVSQDHPVNCSRAL